MKQTLLDLTQEILSSLNSDEVNSIGDTTESLQVAEIVRRTYFNIISRVNLEKKKELFQLTASTDPDKPVLMLVPDKVNRIEWIKYFRDDNTDDTSDVYQYVTIVPITQFLDLTNNLDENVSNVDSFVFTDGPDSWTFKYTNDHQPCYCTVVANNQVIFDSFDNIVDSTLQASKTLCYGEITPTFEMEDTFVPELDENLFALLLNEAKTLAFFEIKQTVHQLAERESKRQWVVAQRTKSVAHKPSDFDQLPYYGRR